MNYLYVRTKDDLRLQGIHYEAENRQTCVLFIHGMSGNSIENYFAHVLGESLSQNGIGFIYSHNRGYNHINDIPTSQKIEKGGYKTKRIGAMYEIFTECLLDIDAWMEEVQSLGYKKIILMGHSLGCNKVIHYFSDKKPADVKAVILASPPDMTGLIKLEKYQKNSEELFQEARKNVAEGNPLKILSEKIWDWYNLSSQTFLSLFTENSEVDNLPVLRNPPSFPQLETINVPILSFMGEYDDIAIRTLEEDLDLIASKTKNCPSFTKKHITGANHTYDGAEETISDVILDWIRDLK